MLTNKRKRDRESKSSKNEQSQESKKTNSQKRSSRNEDNEGEFDFDQSNSNLSNHHKKIIIGKSDGTYDSMQPKFESAEGRAILDDAKPNKKMMDIIADCGHTELDPDSKIPDRDRRSVREEIDRFFSSREVYQILMVGYDWLELKGKEEVSNDSEKDLLTACRAKAFTKLFAFFKECCIEPVDFDIEKPITGRNMGRVINGCQTKAYNVSSNVIKTEPVETSDDEIIERSMGTMFMKSFNSSETVVIEEALCSFDVSNNICPAFKALKISLSDHPMDTDSTFFKTFSFFNPDHSDQDYFEAYDLYKKFVRTKVTPAHTNLAFHFLFKQYACFSLISNALSKIYLVNSNYILPVKLFSLSASAAQVVNMKEPKDSLYADHADDSSDGPKWFCKAESVRKFSNASCKSLGFLSHKDPSEAFILTLAIYLGVLQKNSGLNKATFFYKGASATPDAIEFSHQGQALRVVELKFSSNQSTKANLKLTGLRQLYCGMVATGIREGVLILLTADNKLEITEIDIYNDFYYRWFLKSLSGLKMKAAFILSLSDRFNLIVPELSSITSKQIQSLHADAKMIVSNAVTMIRHVDECLKDVPSVAKATSEMTSFDEPEGVDFLRDVDELCKSFGGSPVERDRIKKDFNTGVFEGGRDFSRENQATRVKPNFPSKI